MGDLETSPALYVLACIHIVMALGSIAAYWALKQEGRK
jgi:hypothetical protein